MRRRDFIRTALPGAFGLAAVAGCSSQGQPDDASVAAGGGAVDGAGSGSATPGNGTQPAAAPSVSTGKNVQWRLASSFPRGLDTIFGVCEVIANRVRELSEGRFVIHVYPAGELVPGLQVLDAVQQGTVQIAQTASYYFTGKNPALAFDCCVPFGLTARQQAAWLTEAGGLELLRSRFADFGIRNYPCGNTGAQMGGWFKRDIESAADLRGLKIRIPGLGGEVMSRLGATVQVLAGGDIYPALERGAIDATEWVGPYDDEKLGFYKVAKKYYYPGWWEPGPSLSLYINQRAWDELPRAYQQMLEAAAQDSCVTMQARYDAKNPPALARLLGHGVEIRRFSDDILEAAENASLEMYAEQAAQDAGYREIYDHWTSFRRSAFDWFATAENAYAAWAFAPGD